ncbi:UNVERIFIED_CONTAM: hypothetical protein HDU68_006902 [Siphonaria sp. JEL0065]|nr:hypothetical protein HDU68_006902 [Siphonaria sp. JEL0065]
MTWDENGSTSSVTRYVFGSLSGCVVVLLIIAFIVWFRKRTARKKEIESSSNWNELEWVGGGAVSGSQRNHQISGGGSLQAHHPVQELASNIRERQKTRNSWFKAYDYANGGGVPAAAVASTLQQQQNQQQQQQQYYNDQQQYFSQQHQQEQQYAMYYQQQSQQPQQFQQSQFPKQLKQDELIPSASPASSSSSNHDIQPTIDSRQQLLLNAISNAWKQNPTMVTRDLERQETVQAFPERQTQQETVISPMLNRLSAVASANKENLCTLERPVELSTTKERIAEKKGRWGHLSIYSLEGGEERENGGWSLGRSLLSKETI